MGEIVSNKIDNVLNKPQAKSSEAKTPVLENKGDQIIELLEKHPLNEPYREKKVKINDNEIYRKKFLDLLNMEI